VPSGSGRRWSSAIWVVGAAIARNAALLGADADPFMLHLYAALAEKERAMISRRTKDALAAKKAKASNSAVSTPRLRPIFAELAGLSNRKMAAELNARKLPTPAGGQWHAVTVKRVLSRLG
jgi:DNA invertase Pin-like site-specific DNA recombinase